MHPDEERNGNNGILNEFHPIIIHVVKDIL